MAESKHEQVAVPLGVQRPAVELLRHLARLDPGIDSVAEHLADELERAPRLQRQGASGVG